MTERKCKQLKLTREHLIWLYLELGMTIKELIDAGYMEDDGENFFLNLYPPPKTEQAGG